MSHRNRSGRPSGSRTAFVILFSLAACSGGGGGGGPSGSDAGGGGGAEPLDEAVRLATIEASHAVYQANLGKPKVERDAALVTFFRSQSTIEAAGVSAANNVWARFTDGTLHLVLDNGGAPAVPAERPRGLIEEEAARPPFLNDLPGGVTAISANSLEPGWRDVSGEIGGWLADAGYTVRTGGLKVDDFENMSDLSVLFWQTHSGMGELRADAGARQPDGGPPVAFAFMTSTLASTSPSQAIKSLRDDGSLATGDVSPTETRYAITDKYIRNRLTGKFAPVALVAIDSCTGASADAAWNAAGVAHFVAWSSESGNLSPIAFERLFDRLLGMNVAAPISNPKERPFPSKAVEPWMQADGYDLDRTVFPNGTPSTARLQFLDHPAHGDFAILRPTIYRVLNTAPAAGQNFYRWTLDGTYGDDPGLAKRTVTLGTTPLDVLQWDYFSVIVKVPPAPIPAGAMQVAVGTRKSEPVRLTEWLIPFTYEFVGEETLKYTLKVNCRLRADVRGFRNQPRDALIWTPTPTWSLEDSNGNLTTSGELHNPVTHELVEAWSGGGPLPWADPAQTNQQNMVLCAGIFDHASSSLTGFAVGAAGTFTKTTESGTEVGSATIAGIKIPMTLTMDWQTLRINGDTLNANPNQLGNNGISAALQWPPVLPSNPPTDDDGR